MSQDKDKPSRASLIRLTVEPQIEIAELRRAGFSPVGAELLHAYNEVGRSIVRGVLQWFES